MTDFFMPCCTKKIDSRLGWLALLIFWAGAVFADGINLEKAEARLTPDGYVLSANFEIKLPPQVEDALRHNVTLYFVSELSLHRTRWYWPDSDIFVQQKTSKLSFNSLTRQFRISSGGGLYQSFAPLPEALHLLGRQSTPPIDTALLGHSGDGYFSRLVKKSSRVGAKASMRLDIDQLPKPLQINAMTNDQWSVSSAEFHWEIKTEAPAETGRP